MVLVHLRLVVTVSVCHAIATDGVGGVLDHGLCLGWIQYDYDYDYIMAPQRGRPYGANHVSVSVLLGCWSGSHCVWIHPMVCLVVLS